MDRIHKRYQLAKERYQELGVNTDEALNSLVAKQFSVHCWQADDVSGLEKADGALEGGGIMVSGNFPGKASNIEELRDDLNKVLSLVPGKHRINLHALYGDFRGKFKDRDQITTAHFQSWVDWAAASGLGLDFNPTFFSHPKASDGFTLSHPNTEIRAFWIEHARRTREIAAFIGKSLSDKCIHNLWIPDGSKDITPSKYRHRELLKDSLDEIYRANYPKENILDTVEGKLFGIGLESFTSGSYDFYLGYAVKNNLGLCLDIGHFHPTESVSDKISSVMNFIDYALIHITRGVHWDSDHIVILNDAVKDLMQEIVWAGVLEKVYFGLDYFDASVNRIGAYVIGIRAAQKALLYALLNPTDKLLQFEAEKRYFERLALIEEAKTLPFGDVWDYFCESTGVPPAEKYISEVQEYEKKVLRKRNK